MYVTLLEASLSQARTCLAMSSSVPRDASTYVRVYSVSTSGSIHTWATTAFVDVYKKKNIQYYKIYM